MEISSGRHVTDQDEVWRIKQQADEEHNKTAAAATRPRDEDKPFPRDSFVKYGTLTEVALSPDEGWAAVGPSQEERVYFLDGRAKSERVIHGASGWGLMWYEPGKVIEQGPGILE